MIQTFADRETQQLFVTGKSKRLPPDFTRRALRRLEYVDLANELSDLKVPPSNRLHALAGIVKGSFQSRSMINGASAFASWMAMPTMSRLRIIIRESPMAIANAEPRQIPPTHPGEMLREDFMPDYGLTTSTLAAALGVRARRSMNSSKKIVRSRP